MEILELKYKNPCSTYEHAMKLLRQEWKQNRLTIGQYEAGRIYIENKYRNRKTNRV